MEVTDFDLIKYDWRQLGVAAAPVSTVTVFSSRECLIPGDNVGGNMSGEIMSVHRDNTFLKPPPVMRTRLGHN
jgi:hypothetical protein